MRPPILEHQLTILLVYGAQEIFKSSLNHEITLDIEDDIIRRE
jgi:hypothetical protein